MNSRNKIKILVTENDKQLTNILLNTLRKEQFFIKTIHKKSLFLTEALSNKYQIIIADVHNDTELKSITQIISTFRSRCTRIPIILVCHNLTSNQEVELYKAGINIIHKRPINLELLSVQIDKLLNENYIYVEIQMGDVFLRPRQRKIFIGKKEIYLTCTEYDFLLLLIKNNGGVLNRDQIISKIFRYTRDVNQCAVDTMVSRIRKKLGGRKQEIIETVPGIGYRLSSKYTESKNLYYK